MKSNKIVLSLAMVMSLVVGSYGTISINAVGNYIGDDDLSNTETPAPASWGVTPTKEQYRYQKEELAGFVHFGPNTFNEIEWGENYGNRTPDEIFKLEKDFDAKTLVKAFKDAGFKKIIVTAKHHDGFCIWNSQYTDYDVAETSYKNGNGDILAEISAECSKYDIDMGLYLSPWDIHEPSYGYYDENGNATTEDKDVLDYNDYYVNQLNEILGNDKYGNNGHFSEIWMDGAKGSGANAQKYDFKRWYDTIQAQEGEEAGFDSECMIFQCGANTTVRWIGNENGFAAKNTWSKSNVDIDADTCNDNVQGSYSLGFENGNKWTVPEADARITSGWFWGTRKNTPKSLTDLGQMYFNSVGHNAPLLLNVPPNADGTVDQVILDRLAEFGENIADTFDINLAANASIKVSSVRGNDINYKPGNVIDGNDDTYWTVDDGTQEGTLLIDLGSTKTFDVVSIEEAIQFGQSINEYKIEYRNGENSDWKIMDEGETIGAKRLVRTSAIKADQIRITVDTNKSDALPIISEVGVYKTTDGFELAGTAPDGMDVIDIEDTNITDGAGFTFNGRWYSESGNNYINGTNRYANAGASLTITFTGSKIYLMGTKDPNHGVASIAIDGGEAVKVDTNARPRATGQMIFASEDLEDGEHTLTLNVDSKAIGIEAAYVINNGGKGMIGLEQSSYTMNENERMDVKIVRVGGSNGTISAKLQPNPGSAIQDDFNTELISDIIMADGVKEITAPVETRRNTNATGDRVFSIELTDPSNGLILGFVDKANVTIKDTETSSLEALNKLLETANQKNKDWYISGWDNFEQALANANEISNKLDASILEIENAIETLTEAEKDLVKREKYTVEDPFILPWKKGSSATLEAEFVTEIVNDESNDNGWPCVITEATWASNGKFIDAINHGDMIKYAYNAPKKGTYHVKAYYRSGATVNKLAWSEENGKIESGEVSAGASSTAATHTAEFDLNVKEAGAGVLVFTGPADKSPQLDKLEIEFVKGVEVDADKTALDKLIKEIDDLDEAVYTAESWNALQNVLMSAKDILSKEDAMQEEVDNIVDLLKAAKDALVEVEIIEANKTALSIAIEMAENASLENVVPAVVEEFNVALENAQIVYDKDNATQEEVDDAFTRLASVMHMLEFFKGDKAALQKMMDQIANLTASEYIESTWNALQAVLPGANEVLDNVNAMQEEVDEVYTELVKAFVNLRLKPNKDLLVDLINKANGLNRANYTSASLKLVEDVMAKASEVLNNPEATKEEVEAAVAELTKALAGLEVKLGSTVDANVPEVKPGDTTVGVKTGDTTNMVYSLGGLTVASIIFYVNKKRKKI
ncbi:alpha-L-fucosidase [Thomasclavelia cocleata]|uniref:alpha-L-fucosidase n=1 Tax=Thomasclavelia cocleata TaxID=69824 RepID=UPI002430C416|nr:alpha-L-fucosidase [Thomasclavelia cocleata]